MNCLDDKHPFGRLPGKSNKPKDWANAWTFQYPAYAGIVRVEYLVARGKRGRLGHSVRTAEFYATGGNAAPRREVRPGRNYPATTSPFINGLCEHCGGLWRNCVLRRGWHAAGQANRLVWLWACPTCYVNLKLSESDQFGLATLHSPLAVHTLLELRVVVLDVTGSDVLVTTWGPGSQSGDHGKNGEASALVSA